MRRYKLSLDLDGTIADFNKKANEVMGTNFTGTHNPWDWKTLSEKCPDLYKDLDLLPDAHQLIAYIRNRFHNKFSVLTAIPKNAIFPGVTAHKRDWVFTRLGPSIKTNFGPFSIDKQYHCEGNHHILVDDNDLCVEQWILRGGIGILHVNAESTIRELQALGFY